MGLGVPKGVLGPSPPSPLMPGQARLPESGVPHDSPLVGHSLRNFALITTGSARSFVFYFIVFYFMLMTLHTFLGHLQGCSSCLMPCTCQGIGSTIGPTQTEVIVFKGQ